MSKAFSFGQFYTDQQNNIPGDPGAYYKSLFLVMIVIQAVFSGLIAGQIASDSVTAGGKHSLILLFSGFIIFILVIKSGIV